MRITGIFKNIFKEGAGMERGEEGQGENVPDRKVEFWRWSTLTAMLRALDSSEISRESWKVSEWGITQI